MIAILIILGVRLASRNYVDDNFINKNGLNDYRKIDDLVYMKNGKEDTIALKSDIPEGVSLDGYIKEGDVVGIVKNDLNKEKNVSVLKSKIEEIVVDTDLSSNANIKSLDESIENISRKLINIKGEDVAASESYVDNELSKYALKVNGNNKNVVYEDGLDNYRKKDDLVYTLKNGTDTSLVLKSDLNEYVKEGEVDNKTVIRKEDMINYVSNALLGEGNNNYSVKKDLIINCYSLHEYKSFNVKLKYFLSYPYTEYIYVNVKDVYNSYKEQVRDIGDIGFDAFLYIPDVVDIDGNKYFKVNTFKETEIICGYKNFYSVSDLSEGIFFYRNIGYNYKKSSFKEFEICFYTGAAEDDIIIDTLIPYLFLGDKKLEFNGKIDGICSSQHNTTKSFYSSYDNKHVIPLKNQNWSTPLDPSSLYAGSSTMCWTAKLTYFDWEIFDTSLLTNLSFMFSKCSMQEYIVGKKYNIDFTGLDTSNVVDMSYMFYCCHCFVDINLTSFNTSNVVDMSYMFYNCYYMNPIGLSSFNTSNVVDMSYMFKGFHKNCANDSKYICENKILDLSSFDTTNVVDMSYMFYDCDTLQGLELSSFNTSNVVDMSYMFSTCKSIQVINISNFVTFCLYCLSNIDGMFGDCTRLHTIDMGNLKFSASLFTSRTFQNDNALQTIYVNEVIYYASRNFLDALPGGSSSWKQESREQYVYKYVKNPT